MKRDSEHLSLARERGLAWLIGALGVAGSVVSFFVNRRAFAHGYLIGFMFWTSVAIGLLAILMLQHVVRSLWGQRIRPWLEAAAAALPVLIPFFVPILLCLPQLYEWTHSDVVAQDRVLQHKRAYLNVAGFVLRSLLYLGGWAVFARLLVRWSGPESRREPVSAEDLPLSPTRVRRLSGFGLVFVVLSVTFASVDWVRSLMPHWVSTGFGLYQLMGVQLGGFALTAIVVTWLRRDPSWRRRVDARCLNDLGKMLFTSTTLWAYIAYTQYLIIWNGSIPEETEFYSTRLTRGYDKLALLLMIGHFALPFALLLPKRLNQTPSVLGAIGAWLLAMHFVDLYWVIAPSYGSPLAPLLAALAPTLAIGGIWIALVLRGLERRTQALPPSPSGRLVEAQ
jgi:hypothetical protein